MLLAALCLALLRSALPSRVVVTGAAGKTGSLVFARLLTMPTVSPIALVRTAASADKMYKLGASKDQVVVCDIADADKLEAALAGAEKVVMCTSATPSINKLSIVKSLVLKAFGQKSPPTFSFPNGDPYAVDWLGAKNQIDAAKKAGVKQFVFLSSMGGTQPDNFLNSIGKVEGEELKGNILLWKRKAEQYLIASRIPYTIVHPGGLLDKKGGEREIVFGVNDALLAEKVRSIPRADVAEVCVQALSQKTALNRAFDIISRDPGVGTPTSEWGKFFAQKGTYKY